MIKAITSLLSVSALLTLCACANQPAVPDLDLNARNLPTVAVEYVTTREQSSASKQREATKTRWRVWRETDRVTTENLATHLGEAWQRDGATLFHQKLFHDDRKVIEYQMDDLRLSNAPLSWPRQALLLDPELLQRLTLKGSGWRDHYPYRRYLGTVDGRTWDITIRTDLLLPVTIRSTAAGLSEHTNLQAVHALAASPWTPTPADDYEHIDYTDLGDRQSDPFVMKAQNLLGHSYSH